jgi:hypothetical protein
MLEKRIRANFKPTGEHKCEHFSDHDAPLILKHAIIPNSISWRETEDDNESVWIIIQITHQRIQRIISYHNSIIRITNNLRVLDQICHPCLHFGVTASGHMPETNYVKDLAIEPIFLSKMLRKHILSIIKRWYINYPQEDTEIPSQMIQNLRLRERGMLKSENYK